MSKAEGKARRQTCTHHAACCGRHFHSLEAFDRHRDREGGCTVEALSSKTFEPLLEVWTDDGWCFLAPKASKDGEHPVRIWTAAGLERRRQGLEKSHATGR